MDQYDAHKHWIDFGFVRVILEKFMLRTPGVLPYMGSVLVLNMAYSFVLWSYVVFRSYFFMIADKDDKQKPLAQLCPHLT